MARHDTLAAVDLGSNSFHLQIGRVVDGQIYPLDAVREVVRLGGGLTADKRIDRATQAQALEALAKFAERLRGFPRQAVRAVGTNALRVAKNSPQFLREARAVLGFPIEVISGREEARLIYLGVAHSLPAARWRRASGAWWSTSAAARPSSSSAPASSRSSPSRSTWAASATA